MYTNIHSNFICSSPNLETIQIIINRWMDEQIMVFPYCGILLINIKYMKYCSSQTIDTCKNMHESQNN